MAAEDGLKAQKLLAQGSALGNVGKNKVALKGQKLSISKLLPFQGDFVVSILKPRALPWAKSFCPFRAYGMWLMTHPLFMMFFRKSSPDSRSVRLLPRVHHATRRFRRWISVMGNPRRASRSGRPLHPCRSSDNLLLRNRLHSD